jgi:hypothetical protein
MNGGKSVAVAGRHGYQQWNICVLYAFDEAITISDS